MEFVQLSTDQLNALGTSDSVLKPYFVGAMACDELPPHPQRVIPQAYIANTHPAQKPGEHWIAVWTEGTSCELLDSYGLDLHTYRDATPLLVWLNQWEHVKKNERALQSIETASCGDYAIVYLMCKARGQSMEEFLGYFTSSDYARNDDIVGHLLEEIIK